MEEETRLPVAGFSGYEVSDLGRLRSFRGPGGLNRQSVSEPKILRSSPNSKGYLVNVLMRDSNRCTRHLHRLVAEHFYEGQRPDTEVSHLDGCKANCRADNLVWESHVRNSHRQFEHGTAMLEARNHKTKLTLEQVAAVKPRRNAGETLSAIARDYGVTVTSIWQIYHDRARKCPTKRS